MKHLLTSDRPLERTPEWTPPEQKKEIPKPKETKPEDVYILSPSYPLKRTRCLAANSQHQKPKSRRAGTPGTSADQQAIRKTDYDQTAPRHIPDIQPTHLRR